MFGLGTPEIVLLVGILIVLVLPMYFVYRLGYYKGLSKNNVQASQSTENVIYCSKCGTKNASASAFCNKCGNALA